MPMPSCDPSVLWIDHKMRWCENGKKGPGWYKLKETGRATFFVKLVSKPCPLCYGTIADHPRPTAWLEAEDKKTRDDGARAAQAERVLSAPAAESFDA